jgi:hypothetical protein
MSISVSSPEHGADWHAFKNRIRLGTHFGSRHHQRGL